jgi:peptide deformylase
MEFELKHHDSLSQVSDPWDFNSDEDPEKLAHQMCQFMVDNHGIGLAANQVGLTKRVFTMGSFNMPGFPKPFALFNPKIVEESKTTVLDKEGCLSYPGLYLSITRPEWAIVEFQNYKGDTVEAKVEGYVAKCFQHELDHLNGICFVDKVSRMKLQLAYKKLRKKLKNG